VTTIMQQSGGLRAPRQWQNLFEITNQADLSVGYRLLAIQGVPAGDEYAKNINRLAKMVAYEIRRPVALVRRGDAQYLALPTDAPLPTCEQRLMPHIATLVPEQHEQLLHLGRLDSSSAPIALAFLQSALRTPLWDDQDLWGRGRLYYSKAALNAGDPGAQIDAYPGFVWNVVLDNGRLYVAVDCTIRYADRLWLTERIHGTDPQAYMRRRCLYHYGHQWYIVQLWGLPRLSITEYRFVPDGGDRVVDVLTYTQERWRHAAPPWVRDLDPDGPAIVYRSPGSEQQRHGALALCKLALSTADVQAAALHRLAILDPGERFPRIIRVVQRHFQHARLGTQAVHVATEPLEVERRVFAVPAQRFGHDQVLAVSPALPAEGTTVVRLDQLGAQRLHFLMSPDAGPLHTSPFARQYLLLPQSLPRTINEDFEGRFLQEMRVLSGQQDYTAGRILYDDRGATSLYNQVVAITEALATNNIKQGYALLVLPTTAHRDLHNYIKRELWATLQFQCATAGKIQSHYHRRAGEPSFGVAPGKEGKLASYVQNCALGMLVTNRKWPWALATPLHYDVSIGIDVLNRMAGVTFVYNHGQDIMFRHYKCKQAERLTAAQMRQILVRDLGHDLRALGIRPQSIVIHRDGRSFASESTGVQMARRELIGDGLLVPDTLVGIVDVRKATADHTRLGEGASFETLHNPTVGSYRVRGPKEGIICTTGLPFRFPGTARPLAAVIAEGALDIAWVLEDLFALSQLIFAAPRGCARLPVTIKLDDDFLEPIAGEADEEAALYEESEVETLHDDEDEEFSREDAGARLVERTII